MPLVLACAAMGTRFELVLPGLDEPRERAAGEAALETIAEWDARLSLFRRDSLVARVNREAGAGPVRVDPQTFELLAACDAIWRASGGTFDAALGAAMVARGFREGADVVEATPTGTWADVELDADAHSVHFTAPGVQLDLGGIAKGFALDRAGDVLREAGVTCALLHGGTSTVLALGAPPARAGWRVALEERDDAPRLELCDRALSVSAQRGRRNAAGQGHVLDPRGPTATPGVQAAAVLAPDALRADAWSTALLLLGALPGQAAAAGIEGLLAAGDEAELRWGPTA